MTDIFDIKETGENSSDPIMKRLVAMAEEPMTRLRLYNTLTRSKEDFVPIDANNVRMYVCGPTVYDFAHIGNARPIIVFDVLNRLLRHLAKTGVWDGGKGETKVTYVRNITDVDDKINARAAERGITIRELTEETARVFHEDVAALGCLKPDVEPRATEHIAEMIAIIEKLIAGGFAYAADGHVLFSVPSMAEYGKLSRRPLDEMIAGARVDVAPYKKGDMDFVLWKPSKDSEPGWDSPWGRGRPGWHIECSAMSWKHLGETFDIHGGGIDLVFPHHENEIAQSRCAFGHDVMANVWMHNGFLQVEGEKMSKSSGNFVTINELLHERKFGSNMWHGRVLRLAMLMTHYRQPIDWTADRLVEARATLKEWIDLASGWEADNTQLPVEFLNALEDDLNMPAALSVLHGLRRNLRLNPAPASSKALASALAFLGLWGGETSSDIFGYGYTVRSGTSDADIPGYINDRLAARAAKNWAESDRIRDLLAGFGIVLKDNKDGTTTWENRNETT